MNKRKLEELLPWYANGTLDEAERLEVEAWLENNPDAQLQLAEYEFLNETVSEVTAEEPVMRQDLFDDLLTRIEAEEQQAANESRAAAAPTLSERLQHWFSDTFQWGMTPAFARVAVVSQFALVMALGAVLLMPSTDEGYEVLSGSDPTAVVQGVLADIGVNPATPVGQFQQLLRNHQAMIVSGPSGIGVYRIMLPEGAQADELLTSLKARAEVVYLQRVSP